MTFGPWRSGSEWVRPLLLVGWRCRHDTATTFSSGRTAVAWA